MIGPMTVVHYRLRGPGAQTKTARKIMSGLPIASSAHDLMFYGAVHWTLALFKWPMMIFNPGKYDLINTAKYSVPKKYAKGKME